MANRNLQAGLAQLKAGDYAEAIAQLEAVLVNELHPGTLFKAKKALVEAYEGDGKLRQAWKLCQELSESTSPEIRDWGDRTLADLDRRYPSLGSEILIGQRLTRQQKVIRAVIQWIKQSPQRVSTVETAWNIIEEERQAYSADNSPLVKLTVNWNIFRRLSIFLGKTLWVWIKAKWQKFKSPK
ncbi:hypothetical protein NG796_13755 [Laspinema sp. A4]|uniref:hypothetical protein n=1 Tax=Laspinema sp. D2d TaxID=2953686 RepID=UPI0021BA6B27|nr:hypothetical protein [Laspinema sp. D2d]MCT7984364.1 hypothetical protein [Laspinema sp. D2d]